MGTYALLGEEGWMLRENSKFTRGRCRVWQIVGKVLTL